MQTVLAPSSLPAPAPQTLRHVLRAEAGRAAGPGGMVVPSVAAAALGTVAGLDMHAASRWMSSTPELAEGTAAAAHTAAATGVESAVAVAALVMSLAAVVRTSRDQGAAFGARSLLVPRRGRLLGAQLGALAGSALPALTATAVLTAAAIGLTGGVVPAGAVGLAGLLAVLAGTALVVLAGGLAAAVRSLPVALLAFVGVMVVLPLAMTMAPMLLPEAIGSAVTAAGAWLPAQAWTGAAAVSQLDPVTPAALLPLVGRLAVLVGWTAAAVLAAVAVVARRDA
ncbi:hypothetical protein [Micrococcus luteus]|uniref:hypothetical protein n=1 Tax=Micrococcus luteus TaxID=1270 RepID=UPI00100959EA|nr:hypothetical protein [Micrococcus luteus]QAV28685.1 hypothetical protein MT1254_04615 [Micrococcus luteus]